MSEAKFPAADLVNDICGGKKDLEEAKKIILDPASGLLNPIDERGTLLVHKACKAGNINLVKFILEQKPAHLKQEIESSGADCLQFAVVSGNLDLVKHLISIGAEPNKKYFMQCSILYYAVKYKHFHIFEYLCDTYKMDPNETLAENGIQALYMAMEQGDLDFFKYLLKPNPVIENIGPFNYLAFAARLDDTFYLEELLKRGAKFEIMEPYDRSAFSWAGEDNRHKQMELLLKNAKGVVPEPLLAPGISQVSHEYNALCDKWWRLYDIYTVRYFCELQRKEVEAKGDSKQLLEDANLQKVGEIINTSSGKYETLMFKTPRNIFRNIMKYLDAPKPAFKIEDP